MNIGILLRTPFDMLVERIHTDLAAHGYEEIRPAHGNVFQFIGKQGARITTMAEKAHMTKQSMSYLVEYLEKHGHVERKADPEDGRAVIFCLTTKGWNVVKIAEESIKKMQQEWRAQMGARNFDNLITGLEGLNAAASDREK